MRQFKPTFDFVALRVKSVEIVTLPDEHSLFRVVCTSVRNTKAEQGFEFVVSDCTGHSNYRLQSFLAATGTVGQVHDDCALIGHVFAVKNGGQRPDDFASLEYASACLRSDRDAFWRRVKYAEECSAAEWLDAAA